MRLILDENIPQATVEAIQDAGYSSIWIRTGAPGISDLAILAWAAEENRLVLTLDKDFRQLALQKRGLATYGVILFRVHPAIPANVTPLVLQTLAKAVDWLGYCSVVSPAETRMFRLPAC